VCASTTWHPVRVDNSPMHLPCPLPCQQPDVDSVAHRNDKDSEHARGPREDLHIDSHAYTSPTIVERPIEDRKTRTYSSSASCKGPVLTGLR
jgi:hypothetical protein